MDRPIRWFRRAGLSSAMLLASVVPTMAQTGSVRGTITDVNDGRPLSGALVRVLGLDARAPLTGTSGGFELVLAPGSYVLVAERPGYGQARSEPVEVIAGGVAELGFELESVSDLLDPPNVTAEPGRSVPTSTAPARVVIVPGEQARRWGGPSLAASVQGLPGIDVAQTGLTPSNIVGRGFNNVFSGALLVLSDYRYARLPSLRLNAYNMIPTSPLDLERIEVVLGPAAALYGPNAANSVLHLVTSSPIDRQGTEVSVAGGERSTREVHVRHAARLRSRAGFKISGQYFRGTEWEHLDPVEESSRSPEDPRIGQRDLEAERFATDARLDVRPWGDDGGEIVLGGGLNQIDGIELTPLGAAQAVDWRYAYGQARLEKGGLFAQAFVNQTDAGDTYLLRTGKPISDASRALVAQTRYSFPAGVRQEWVVGVDFQRTEPRTLGTITGANEDDDVITEFGGYVHSRTALSDRADFLAAARIDRHDRLEDPNFSPRLGLVFTPEEGHTFRLTYNRAFNTPTTNNLFLDISAGTIPLGPGVGYDIRAVGTPSSGLTYDERCEGGVDGLCMVSPLAPDQRLAADGSLLWDGALAELAQHDATLSRLAPLLGSPGGDPGDPTLGSRLLSFDQESATFLPASAPRAIEPLRSTIKNTLELGYKGLFADKLAVSVDVYSTLIRDFVGPLRVETPSVFLTAPSIEEFVRHRLAGPLAAGDATEDDVALIVGRLAAVPLGTIAPDQRNGPEILVTSRNFGEVDLWGADLGFELRATPEVSVLGSFSWVSEECFDFDGDGRCSSSGDIALNAPGTKGSLGARFESAFSPVSLEARMRYIEGFPMNSGAFTGEVEGYTVFDANVTLALPSVPGATFSVVANNVLDVRHREFVGAPTLGRLAMARLQFRF